MDATGGGYRSLWRTSGFSAFDNTFVLARPAALAHVLTRREIAFHLMSARDWGFWGVRELSWQTQVGRKVSADFTCQRERTRLETLAIGAHSGAE